MNMKFRGSSPDSFKLEISKLEPNIQVLISNSLSPRFDMPQKRQTNAI
jgi:hypothetical protein